MIDYLVRSGGERSLPRFFDELIRSRDLNRALQRVYRVDVRELETRFLGELGSKRTEGPRARRAAGERRSG